MSCDQKKFNEHVVLLFCLSCTISLRDGIDGLRCGWHVYIDNTEDLFTERQIGGLQTYEKKTTFKQPWIKTACHNIYDAIIFLILTNNMCLLGRPQRLKCVYKIYISDAAIIKQSSMNCL